MVSSGQGERCVGLPGTHGQGRGGEPAVQHAGQLWRRRLNQRNSDGKFEAPSPALAF